MYLCRHANGSVKEYVEEAIRMGFASLGMSDHAPFRELMDRSVRMGPEDLETYLKECDDAIENYKTKSSSTGARDRILSTIPFFV